MKVKVVSARSIEHKGETHSADSGAFEMDAETFDAYQALPRSVVVEADDSAAPAAPASTLKDDYEGHELQQLPSVDSKNFRVLTSAGFKSVKSIADAEEEALIALKGIGKVIAQRLIEEAWEVVETE